MKRKPTRIPMAKKTAAMRLGSRNGNAVKSLLFSKRPGRLTAGLAKKPPNAGPRTEPMDQTRGMMEKARGWSTFSGTISATMVLIMPTLPLPAPESALAAMAQGKEVEKPQRMLKIMVDVRPIRIICFRPRASDARPHTMAVQHWLMLKTALVIPRDSSAGSLDGG